MEPTQETLGGSGFGASLRRYGLATRPKFLSASVLPVLLGTALGVQVNATVDVWVFVLALGAVVSVHAAANVLNDVYDDMTGNDAPNDARIFPYTGGSRFIQNEVMSRDAMARLGVALLAIGACYGGALALLKGEGVVAFGVAGAALGWLYSAPPVRLSAHGLGEVAVAIAFGPLPVAGAAWLQCARLDGPILVASLPVAFWIANVLLINEVPDREADANAGRKTLAVRLGDKGTALLYGAFSIAAVAGVAWSVWLGVIPVWGAALPAGLLFVSFAVVHTLHSHTDDRGRMTKAIERTLMIHALGVLWLIVAVSIGA